MIRTMLKRLIRTAISSPLILAVIVVTVPLSGCGLRQPPATARSSAAIAPRVPSGSEKFADATSDLEAALEAASRGFAKGSVDTTALAGIRSFSGKLTKLDRGVRADFAKARKILKKIDSPEKDAIQKRVERQYEQRSETLRTKLYDIEQARGSQETSVAVAALAEWLEEINPDPPMQPLGAELPHRIVDRKAGPPVLGTAIAPAYAPDTPGAIPSTLPVEPTPEDLAETIEVQFSPEIRSLATSLGNDPVRMYEWVRNNIDFEPYYGSRKGATETLLEGSGNDIDTASLLIALYRVSGIPARYVSGVVDVPIEKAMNWVGVETPESASKLLSAAGTPTKLVMSAAKPKTLCIEHVWAEVCMGYEDYRGSGGSSDSGKTWTPVSVAVKAANSRWHVDVWGSLPPSAESTYVSYVTSATSLSGTATIDVDYPMLVAASSGLASATLSAVDPVREGAVDVSASASASSGCELLPSRVPFLVRQVEGEWVEVPEGLRSKLRVALDGSRGSHVEVEKPLAAVGESSIVLGFEPATVTDQSIRLSAERIEDVPAYLVDVQPWIGVGEVRTRGAQSLTLGDDATLSVYVAVAGAEELLCETPVRAGGLYAVGLDLGRIASERVAQSASRFTSSMTSQQQTELLATDYVDIFGDMLHAGALLYFRSVDLMQDQIAQAYSIGRYRAISALVTGTTIHAARSFGTTARVSCPSLMIDVGSDASISVPKDNGSSANLIPYNIACGAVASSTEGWLWSALLGAKSAGISTMSVLSRCAEQRIPLLLLDRGNVEQVLSTVEAPRRVVVAVRESVTAGLAVLLPAQESEIGDWTGFGYVAFDPDTGNGGYMLQEGIAGGIDPWEGVEQALWAMMSMVLLTGPVRPGIQLAAYLESAASLSVSYGTTMEFIMASGSPDAASMEIVLTGVFLAAWGSMKALAFAGLGAKSAEVASGGWYQSACVSQALAVASLAVGMTFWVSTVVIREML